MLISSILFLLLSNAVTLRRDKSILYSRIGVTIFICCFVISLNGLFLDFQDKGIGLFGGFFVTSAISHTFQMFIFLIVSFILLLTSFYPRKLWAKNYNSILKLLIVKFEYLNNFILNKKSEQYRIIEYSLIILFIVLGGIFLMSSSDLISIFLSIELQSYGLYIICTLYRDSERATSGGLTYFLLGGLSSCFILLGSGLLYANSGNTSFDGLYIMNNVSSVSENLSENLQSLFPGLYKSYYINFSFIIMSVGFLFKISAAPFHFWSPDVYDAIPTIVTTFVAVFAKITIFILLLELVHYSSNLFTPEAEMLKEKGSIALSWTFTILVSSLLSLIIGAVLGLTQFRIKRLYAYSTISHIGFMLLALTINNMESVQSFMFYLMQYSLSNLNAFIILVAVGYSLYMYIEELEEKKEEKQKKELDTNKQTEQSIESTQHQQSDVADNIETKSNIDQEKSKKEEKPQEKELTLSEQISDINNSPLQLVSQMKGYFYVNPILAISFAITLFSFIGIPPLVGFFAKQMVLTSALDNGYVFMALVAILSSVISAYYYLVVIKQIFFNKTNYKLNPVLDKIVINVTNLNRYQKSRDQAMELNINNISLSASITITISVLTLIILLFILNPQEWLNMMTILSLILFTS